MFNFARKLVQHKVGVVAVIAFAVVMFSQDGGSDKPRPRNAWSSQPAQVAPSQSDDDSMIGSAVGKVAAVANDYIGEQTGVDARQLKEQTVDSWDNTAEAYKQANRH